MILPIEMHSSVHLHSFTCAVSLEGMPAFYRLCKWVLPTASPGGDETSPNPCTSIDKDCSQAQAPRGLCPQRCSVKSSITCWSPPRLCESWGASAVLTPALSWACPPEPTTKKVFCCKGIIHTSITELMPKFASPEGEGWEKWILLSWVKEIPLSSKLWSPHRPEFSDRGCSHSVQRLLSNLMVSLSGHGTQGFPGC